MANGTLQLGTEGVPEKLYLASETSLLGGVILLKLFDLSNGFKVIDFKISSGYLQKSYFGPPKTQKIDFLKKLELYDLAAHSWGLPQYPVTRSHWPF